MSNKLKQQCSHKETKSRTREVEVFIGGKGTKAKFKETVCKNPDCGMVLKSIPATSKEA